MALVNGITEITKERQTLHGETTCLSSVFTDDDGRRYIQLDTYGSKTRQLANKVSQSIQLSEQAATQLKRLIESTYPGLK
jgi:hypothetical protein